MHAVNTRQQASTHKDPEGLPRRCSLQDEAGGIEACSTACPFWEEGGAVIPGGCMLKRLELDLKGQPELVEALLEIRRMVERAPSRAEEEEARSLFYRLLATARRDV